MEEKIDPQPAMEPEAELPVPSFWENLKANKFKILGGILGVFVFAGAVFGAYKLGQRQVQPGPSPTPTPAVVATPTPDPTANWKTYTNTKYGYSIKYPTDWVLQPDKQTPDEIVNFGKDFYSISIYAGSASTGVPPGAVPSEISSVTIAGQEATREVYEGLKILVKFPEELEVNQIVMSVEYSETFNLMLSTFRFLEETTPPVVDECGPEEIVAEDERIRYPECEANENCYWQYLGGKIKPYYACCPKSINKYLSGNVEEDREEISRLLESSLGRCFLRVD